MAAVGHYEVRDRLGGSRATVHLGVDPRTGRSVVLKSARWDRPAVTAALAREAAILRRVRHPSLVELVDVVEDLDGRTLVLAHGARGDLTRVLAVEGALDPERAAGLGACVAGALAALHAHAIVHRDVRPSNVVLDAELLPVLCDLDHALDPSQPRLDSDGDVVGDTGHLDPRVLDGMPQGPAMDLFGLGSVVWAAASGGLPRPDDVGEATGTLPPSLLTAVAACLAGTIGDARSAATAFEAAAVDAVGWRPSVAAPRPRVSAPDGPTDPRPGAPRDHGSRPRGDAGGDVGDGPVPSADDAETVSSGPPHASRAASLVGGRAAEPGRTRRWRAPAADPEDDPEAMHAGDRSRRGRVVAVGVAVATVVAAGAVAWTSTIGRPPTAAAPSDPSATTATEAATARPREGPALVPVTPPPPCPDQALPRSGGGSTALADVSGRGCSIVLSLADGVLTSTDGEHAVGEAGDQLVAGDWDGSGTWSPGLYRPATGQLFLFDAAPSAGQPLTSRPAEHRAPHGIAVVVSADPTAHHEVVVTPRAQPPATPPPQRRP